jgi:TIR domain-containing protein
MTYDLFISYSSKDREWAAKVNTLLSRRIPALKTFFDINSLRGGDQREKRIEDALKDSKHLLVLWSDSAGSDWVPREVWTYAALARPTEDPSRRLVWVNLQGSNLASKAYQQIEQPALRNSYPNASAVSDAEWTFLIAAIEDALRPKQPLSVPLVVLSATQAQLAALAADRWQMIESDFGIPRPTLLEKYGATLLDWEPFAQPKKMSDTVDSLRDNINLELSRYRVSWRLPDAAFWDARSLDAAQQFIDNEFRTAPLSVLVIDPVAIHLIDVLQRLMLFQDDMANSSAVIVTLPPFGAPADVVRLRAALIERGRPYFNDYFKRKVPAKRKLAAQCGWNVSDWTDVERHILAAADYLRAEDTAPPNTSAFVRQGTRA